MLPALTDPQGFTIVLSSGFEKQGKQKARCPFPVYLVLPVLLPALALPQERSQSQPCRGTHAEKGCFHSYFREGAAVEEFFIMSPCSLNWDMGTAWAHTSDPEIFDGSESAQSGDADCSGTGGAQGSSGSVQRSDTFSHSGTCAPLKQAGLSEL